MKSKDPQSSLKKWMAGAAVLTLVGGAYWAFQHSSSIFSSPDGGGSERSVALEGSIAEKFSTPAKSPVTSAPTASLGAGAAPKRLLKAAGPVTGSPLPVAGMNPAADKGRVLKLDAVALRSWAGLKAGDKIQIPGISGDELEGTVGLVVEDNGWIRMGGDLADGSGTFSLSTNFDQVAGMILQPNAGVGFQIVRDGFDLLLVERRIGALVCAPGIAPAPEAIAADRIVSAGGGVAAAGAQTIPVINTRPGAKGLIYVDFDGETVTDPAWSRQTIVAAASTLSGDQIAQVIASVAEDYAPFDVTITTDRAAYDKAPVGSRMHAIVTSTDTVARGTGGVAFVNSWSGAGSWAKSDVVCWIFNQGVKSCADSIAHEVGHTLGLSHDGQKDSAGRTTVEYYAGHGGSVSTPTSWAPIMGAGFSRNLVQFSKGEYVSANNTEDDLAIVSKTANRFGYLTEIASAGAVLPLPLSGNGTTFETTALLAHDTSAHTFSFRSTGGRFTASARPYNSSSNLDVRLEVSDASGATVAVADPVDALAASLSQTLTAGTYKLTVRPAGTGAKPAAGYTTGYSAYDSLGSYVLSGSLEGGTTSPFFLTPTQISGTVGTPLSTKIGVTPGSTVTVVSKSLPSWASFDPATLTLSGTPTAVSDPASPSTLVLLAKLGSATTQTQFNIVIAPAEQPLSGALGAVATGAQTSTDAPWKGVSKTLADGTTGTVAASGQISNNGKSWVRFNCGTASTKAGSRWSVLSFYWKVSSEANGDFLACSVDGVLQRDATTGRRLAISGETGWVKQSLWIDTNAAHVVEFAYLKDPTLSSGEDRGWVYGLTLGALPAITAAPVSSIKVTPGTTAASKTFTLTATVENATSLVWKREGITLKDGTSSSGSVVSGATTASVTVSNVGAGDAGVYWLEATNENGTVSNRGTEVQVVLPPVFTSLPVAPAGLKIGDPLVLTASASGAQPIIYRWNKDGVAGRWSSSSSLNIPKTTKDSAGLYSVTAINPYGTVTSGSVTVSFGAAAPSTVAK